MSLSLLRLQLEENWSTRVIIIIWGPTMERALCLKQLGEYREELRPKPCPLEPCGSTGRRRCEDSLPEVDSWWMTQHSTQNICHPPKSCQLLLDGFGDFHDIFPKYNDLPLVVFVHQQSFSTNNYWEKWIYKSLLLNKLTRKWGGYSSVEVIIVQPFPNCSLHILKLFLGIFSPSFTERKGTGWRRSGWGRGGGHRRRNLESRRGSIGF